VTVLGLDIGGANLKAAVANDVAVSQPFALWKNPVGLAKALRTLLADLPRFDALAVTMTGEFCDCFETKRQGVQAILDAVAAAAGPTAVRVWQTTGRFMDLGGARANPLPCAAANWLALATFAGRFAAEGPVMLIDVGSTTTDIVPLQDGQPAPRSRTDTERLRCKELVYTGVRRTPLCALLGDTHAAELFATSLDAYLVLGRVVEDASDRNTADGRPATRAAAHDRLARMIGADRESCTANDVLAIARRAHEEQTRLIGEALAGRSFHSVILAGEGEFLARDALADFSGPIISLASRLGPKVSEASCAYAVAMLASEGHHG
jgi:probable H4MPT-linked C1 transfer pathway protein